ncbi:hypothetical protein BCR37DRAFT_201988 [Protomyces lactucae-debilis]|uniref:Uncharacterized protein n=1 Tax=Protomyces lactucae-debilis TaxID=2754530 RepID=A0A1Y2ESP6_PROLT|nr:uncharacterized protein BCR37DRAFT_201988 [Protomyces lactucae-debilis]ORY74599.1 hypothetical protein BCR37DRAFT_201988 [Protomyces lactucae-debilis]
MVTSPVGIRFGSASTGRYFQVMATIEALQLDYGKSWIWLPLLLCALLAACHDGARSRHPLWSIELLCHMRELIMCLMKPRYVPRLSAKQWQALSHRA